MHSELTTNKAYFLSRTNVKNKIITSLIALTAICLSAGCGLPQHARLAPGNPVPTDKVLVVTRTQFNPPISQNFDYEKYCVGPGCAGQGEVELFLYPDNGKEITMDPNASTPLKGASEMHVSFEGFSFILMPPGKWYIRHGIVTHTRQQTDETVICGTSIARYSYQKLLISGDLEVKIPLDARAVYIGDLLYDHDGSMTQKVRVRDEYNQARKALEKMNFMDIKGSDLKRMLATVVGSL